nr:MAG TPA: hypothetical protein [Crassvirales sp.]
MCLRLDIFQPLLLVKVVVVFLIFNKYNYGRKCYNWYCNCR